MIILGQSKYTVIPAKAGHEVKRKRYPAIQRIWTPAFAGVTD